MSKKTSEAWHHNSLIGHAVMIQKTCVGIYSSRTTSETARLLAREIYRLAGELEANLRNERIDK